MPNCVDTTSYRLYEITPNGSRRIAELISRAKAERLVRSKSATEAVDWDGKTTCYFRMVQPKGSKAFRLGMAPVFVPVAEAESERSNTAFSKPEVSALAGTNFRHGRSLTARMTEEQRQNRKNRHGKRLPTEDVVERATNKKKAWELMGPALQELVREVAVV